MSTILQLRESRYRPSLGRARPIWAVADDAATASFDRGSANPLLRLLRRSVLTVCALINRLVEAMGLCDSLLVKLRRGGQ